MSKRVESLSTRLEAYPSLKHKIEKLLDVIEDQERKFIRLDDAEDAVVERMDGFGQEILSLWGAEGSERKAKEFEAKNKGKVYKNGKKKSGCIRSTAK